MKLIVKILRQRRICLRRKKSKALLLLIFLFSLWSSSPRVFYALAAETPRLAVYPTRASDPNDPRTNSWFIYKVKSGQIIESEVTVENKSQQPLTGVEIYAVDATANADGAFTLKAKGNREDAGAWIKIGGVFGLAGKAKGSLPFTINVPADAPPGDRVAGIAAELPVSGESVGGSGLKIIQRVGVRLYLTVEGERINKLDILSSKIVHESGKVFIKYRLQNTGNTNLDLRGEVVWSSILGEQTVNLGNLGQILVGKVVDARVAAEPPSPLNFAGRLTIAYDSAQEVSQEFLTFSDLTPVIIFLVSLIALILLISFLVLRRRRPVWPNR